MPSAFAAMQGSGGTARREGHTRRGRSGEFVPAIVFHGDRDTTVNPRNADAVVAQSARPRRSASEVEQGQVPGGHAYSRTLHADAAGGQ